MQGQNALLKERHAQKIIEHWRGASTKTAFHAWRGRLVDARRQRAAVRRYLVQWQYHKTGAAFREWSGWATERRRRRYVMTRFIKMAKHRHAAKAYACWCEYVNVRKEQRIREARVGERVAWVLRRCQMDLVRRSWVGWREFVAVRRFQRSEGLIQAQTRDLEQEMRETRMRSARFNNVFAESTFTHIGS